MFEVIGDVIALGLEITLGLAVLIWAINKV